MKRQTESSKTKLNIALMVCFDILLIVITVLLRIMYEKHGNPLMLTAFITMMTISYHFIMRIIVGQSVTVRYRNRDFNLNSFILRLRDFEPALYRKLRVRKWKKYAITAKPEQFDIKALTPDELIHNVAQAETVHWINVVLSFFPLVLIIPYGAAWVFIITSLGAALIDFRYVIIQRFNRPQMMKYKRFKERRNRRVGK